MVTSSSCRSQFRSAVCGLLVILFFAVTPGARAQGTRVGTQAGTIKTGQTSRVTDLNVGRMNQDSTPAYFEYQVDQPVTAISWGHLRYPPDLKAKRISGSVVLRFIVDSSGHVERGSERVLRTSHPAFTAAAMSTLSTARLTPALRKDKHVRQVVEQAFVFEPKR
jgi:TonB family protein